MQQPLGGYMFEIMQAKTVDKATQAKINKKAMNKLVKFCAANQNKNKPLNAGQWREAIKLATVGIATHLEHEEADSVLKTFRDSSLSKDALKQRRISALESELKSLKA